MVRVGKAPAEALELNLLKPIPTRSNKKAVRYALTVGQLERISKLPKRVGEHLQKIWVRGLDRGITESVLNNTNPFSPDSARPYHAAYNYIKRNKASKGGLANHLMDELGWKYNSAYSQVSMIWQIFPELGIAKIDGIHMIAFNPRNHEHNTENNIQGL